MNSSDSTTLAQEIIVKMAGQSIIYHTGFKTTLQTPTYRGNMCEIYTRHESDHCLPSQYVFPISIDILEILKSKNSFLAHFFLSKTDYFSSRWCKIVLILEWMFGFIYFVKYLRSYLQKNVNRGSDKYEIWCVEQLGCAERKNSR